MMTYDEFITSLPVKLNTQQLNAVKKVDGPTLLLAVPGSGKTTVLISRLGYMIKCININPKNILTLTYTVAAADDMRKRFSSFFGEDVPVKFCTINSICSSVIYEYGKTIGKEPFELESDEKKLIQRIARIYQSITNEFPNENDLKDIKKEITYIKNMMFSDEEIEKYAITYDYPLKEIYVEYCKSMRIDRLMDFDDQMIYALRMLQQNPELLKNYQNRYKYICVDEAQDTSLIQHIIIALLAKTPNTDNLFMVGDEDQSIYGFRAAAPQKLLDFEKEHPGASVLLMETNFRSNANIVSAADGFIQNNKFRHPKKMVPNKSAASQIHDIPLKARQAQYSYILKAAQDYNECAVLYRDNESVIPLIDLFDRAGVDFNIKNAELSFFTHRLTMDIVNIINFSLEPKNVDLFMQIYYKISYIKKAQAQEACEIAHAKNIPVLDAVLSLELKPYLRKNLNALKTHLTKLPLDAPGFAINRIVNYMGYGDYLDSINLSTSRLYTLRTIAGKTNTIPEFLKRIEELKEIIQNREYNPRCPLTFSTIHGSKGLEWKKVFIIDAYDGMLPEKVPSDDSRNSELLQNYEEERRLFYVGVTRAKDELYLFSDYETTSFINELLNKKAKKTEKEPNSSARWEHKSPFFGSSPNKPFDPNDSDFKKFSFSLSEGVVVRHKKFGIGTVVSYEYPYLQIQFENSPNINNFLIDILYKNQLIEIL